MMNIERNRRFATEPNEEHFQIRILNERCKPEIGLNIFLTGPKHRIELVFLSGSEIKLSKSFDVDKHDLIDIQVGNVGARIMAAGLTDSWFGYPYVRAFTGIFDDQRKLEVIKFSTCFHPSRRGGTTD